MDAKELLKLYEAGNRDFCGANLRGVDLTDSNLLIADLNDAKFSTADLSYAKFNFANLISTDLNDANLSFAELVCTDLNGAILMRANLNHANLSQANLKGANLRYANLSNVDLSGADLSINWQKDSMYGMYRTFGISTSLRNAILINANLCNADLSNVYLNRANLSGANLSGANLSGARLVGVKIINSNLRDANLYGAKLSHSSFRGADLRGADLRHTKLSSVNLRKAYFDKKTTRFPPNFDPIYAGMFCLDVDYKNPNLINILLADQKSKKYINPPPRLGQDEFRQKLLQAYNGKCAISECEIKEVLEAAHIIPWMGDHSHEVWNGLLLRADLHKLFDSFLLTIHPKTYKIIIAPSIINSYKTLFKTETKLKLRFPKEPASRPDEDVLKWHHNEFRKRGRVNESE